MKFFARRLATDIPLMMETAIADLVATEYAADDVRMAEHPSWTKMREQMKPAMTITEEGIAKVPIQGPLAYAPDIFEMVMDGVEDSRTALKMMEEAKASKDCKGVLIQMNTPGGMLLGGPEIADAVMACRRAGKPVVAHIGGMGASLGYMIASQASEVIASRSAIVGSIGVIASLPDYSAYLAKLGIKVEVFTNKEAKFKGAGAIGTSLTSDQRENVQSQIDAAFSMFKSMVLSNRPGVKIEAMQGQTFRGEQGQALGLVDRIGSESFAMGILRKMIG